MCDAQVFTGVDEECILTCAKAFDPEAVSVMLLPVEDVFGKDELNQLTAQGNLASQTPER